ncbi:MAG: glycoside hydrolase family 27 protein [Bryobacteraceae bacterium]
MRWFRLCTALLAGLTLASAQSPTGKWIARYSPDDEAREIVLALNVESGGTVTGYVLAPNYEDRIVEGTASGAQVTFVAEREANNNTRRRSNYSAVLEGGKLKLTMPAAGNRPPQVIEFTRASAEAQAPLPPVPPKISLPAPAAVRDNGLARTPPMGWNSWNKFQGKVNDKVVREIADAMVKSGMKDAGYVYVNIDDTWESARDSQGNIGANSKFPDLKALADYVHGKGLKLGIYSSPGPKTCAGYEGSYQHEAQDARTYAAWGIDYLKYDWCSAARVYAPDAATMQAAYARMGEALLASGRPMVYSLCQYGMLDVGEWGAKVSGNLWRTTGDISDRWQSMSHIGFDLQPGREKYAAPGHWNDPDMLEIGNGGMSDTEYRTHMSLWCLLAAPLLAGNDLRDVKPGILEILTNKEVIAVDQDKLGKQGVRLAKYGDLEMWVRPLADGGYAVGLFNRGDAAAKATATFSDIGVPGSHAVRDLWEHADKGTFADEYTAEVPSHGVVMIKIAK